MRYKNIIITDRDIKIFELIKKFGWIREDYLAKYLGFTWGDARVKNNLATIGSRLSAHGLVKRQKIIDSYPVYWTLGAGGAEFIGGIEEKKIVLMLLRHNDLVAEVAVDILAHDPEAEIVTEYTLKQEVYGKPAKLLKLPDLVVNRSTAVEIELSKKDDRRLAAIIASYLDSGYSRIIYYTNSRSIADRLYALSAANPRFEYQIFRGNAILAATAYIPQQNTATSSGQPSGQFESAYANKLKQMGLSIPDV